MKDVYRKRNNLKNYSFDDYFNDYRDTCKANGDLPLGYADLNCLGKHYLNTWISKMVKEGIFESKNTLNERCGYLSPQFYRLSNGYYVRSSLEVKFANFLIHNNLPFEVDKVIDNKSRKKFRYDFLLYNISREPIYIEIWGMESHSMHKSTYKKKQKAKKAFCKRRNLKLVNISSYHFEKKSFKDLQDFFKKILKENKIKLNKFKTLSSAELLQADSESAWTAEKVFKQYQSISFKNGNQPLSQDTLKAMGYGGLARAINKYYPGRKVQLDKDLGFKNMQSPAFSLSDIKKQIKDLVIANNEVPLLGKELVKMGHRPMVRSISHNYSSSLTEIYNEIGYGKEYDTLVSHGKSFLSRKKANFVRENSSEILKDYKKYGRNKTAKIWGVSISSVSRWMIQLGVITKNKNLTSKKSQVLKDHNELGTKKTAKKYNVHISTMSKFIKKHRNNSI